jgi:hypothetical protein
MPIMRPLKAHLALLLAGAALLAVPAPIAAAAAVPPGNSAANQYTETYPTASGDRETKRAEDVGGASGGGGAKIDPKTERNLEAEGGDGRRVVELVEATAPVAAVAANGSAGEKDPARAGDPAAAGSKDDPLAADSSPSATEEVLGQATGASSSSSSGLGLILALVIVATLGWAIGFFWRRRGEA